MSGTVSGALAFDQGDTGPFRCYFVLQRFGPGGQTQDTVSDTVEMQFHAAPLNNPNPGVGNMPPGMNMPNPNTNPNPNPNPNPNGMPPFGRRGAPPRPPGFPPGFPRRP
jgi:hypothetical protein